MFPKNKMRIVMSRRRMRRKRRWEARFCNIGKRHQNHFRYRRKKK